MKAKAIIVCSDSPYPVVVGGYERLISDYQRHVFSDYDVYLLVCHDEGECELLHYGVPVPAHLKFPILFEEKFEFSVFIDPKVDFDDQKLITPLATRVPSFCFVQRHPEKQIKESLFRGILTHFSKRPHSDLLRIGGCYDPEIFYKKRSVEESYVLCVARLYPDKNQLELVREYKEKIYDRFGLPLYLVGGTDHLWYFTRLRRYIDGETVISTAGHKSPMGAGSWRTAPEIADLCSRARLFVMPSPRESFCIAMIEAMACGLTCVVNGNYYGFEREDLRPNVFGPITRKCGPIVDTIASALEQNVRIDASEWVKKFTVDRTKERLLSFIKARL